MNSRCIYYSCSTWLAYLVCQRYYGNVHYAWCAPVFDAASVFNADSAIPPSSNPRDIYWSLKKDVACCDLHSAKIKAIRRGILRGAAARLNAGMIDYIEYQEIQKIVKRSSTADFRPLMFVIPVRPIAHMLIPVAVNMRASLFSEEYIIRNLPRNRFDAVEL